MKACNRIIHQQFKIKFNAIQEIQNGYHSILEALLSLHSKQINLKQNDNNSAAAGCHTVSRPIYSTRVELVCYYPPKCYVKNLSSPINIFEPVMMSMPNFLKVYTKPLPSTIQ